MGGTRRNLTIEDRKAIESGLRSGTTVAAMARALGRNPSVIRMDVSRHGGRAAYDAEAAHAAVMRNLANQGPPRKVRKLIPGTPAFIAAAGKLLETWSPEQVAKGVPEVGVGKDAIYASIRALPPGDGKDLLVSCLRRGRKTQAPVASKKERRARRIPGLVPLDERPSEVATRESFGHWECDLVIGAGGRSRVGSWSKGGAASSASSTCPPPTPRRSAGPTRRSSPPSRPACG